MGQTDTGSIRQQPKSLYSAAIICGALAFSVWLWNKISPPVLPPLIHWRTLNEAKAEAARTRKPVLYFFSAEWCGPCKKMEKLALQCKDIAQTINTEFIPVHVVDQSREKGENPDEIEKLQKQFRVWSFPTMAVVPFNLIDASTSDTLSTGNSIERALAGQFYELDDEDTEHREGFFDWFDSGYGRLPVVGRYLSPASMRASLFKMRFWHKLPPALGNVNWKPLSALEPKSTSPILIAFVEDVGFGSDHMRLKLFSNKKSASFINDNFVPVLAEIKRGSQQSSPQLLALKAKYKIEALPALVVLKGTDAPMIQDGFLSREHAMQFLKRATGK